MVEGGRGWRVGLVGGVGYLLEVGGWLGSIGKKPASLKVT
jgi:hypothetical protein